MRLAVVSSRFPFENHEPYLGAELSALHSHIAMIAVAPLRGNRHAAVQRSHGCLVLASVGVYTTLKQALRAFRRAPSRAFSALRAVVREPVSLPCKLKNLAIFPRALELSERMHRLGIEHVHAYWLSTPATAAYIISKVNGIPWSSTAHRWDIFENNMLAEKAHSAQFVRAISERGRREIIKRTGAISNIYVMRLGAALCVPRDEVAATVLLRDALVETQKFTVLCAAAFVHVKGHEALIEAFAHARMWNPSLRLTLAGKGPLEGKIRQLVAKRNLTRAVDFRGYIPHTQLLEEMRSGAYHAIVLASRDNGKGEMEGIPSILIEAMSLGVPCVATASGSVPELLDRGTGYIVPVHDTPALADALLKVSIDTQGRNLRIKHAFARVRSLHAPDRLATRLSAFILNTYSQKVLAS